MKLNDLSEALLLTVKKGEPSKEIRDQLAQSLESELFSDLKTDDQKKAFWINCYNAFYQILRKERKLTKPGIYRGKAIRITGLDFSLDNIEHGILRRNKFKWSLGYLSNPFAPRLLERLAVDRVDYRIHFALNCGARSCPPIAFYNPDKIHEQLELATQSFLESETEVYSEKNEIHISRLFKWFRGDFEGQKGIQSILERYLKSDLRSMKLMYKPYRWDEKLDNFAF